jgi:hypothetical protein
MGKKENAPRRFATPFLGMAEGANEKDQRGFRWSVFHGGRKKMRYSSFFVVGFFFLRCFCCCSFFFFS